MLYAPEGERFALKTWSHASEKNEKKMGKGLLRWRKSLFAINNATGRRRRRQRGSDDATPSSTSVMMVVTMIIMILTTEPRTTLKTQFHTSEFTLRRAPPRREIIIFKLSLCLSRVSANFDFSIAIYTIVLNPSNVYISVIYCTLC